MGFFKKTLKEEKKKDQILSKSKINVDELGYLLKNCPGTIAKETRPVSEILQQKKAYFDEEPINDNKRKILNLHIGDIVFNAAGAKWYVEEITPWEIVFHYYSGKSHASTFTKWDLYLALKMNVPMRFM